MTVRPVLFAITLMGGAALIAGCDKPAPPAPAATASVATPAAPPAVPAPKPPFSINEMMIMMVDNPGEVLWSVEQPGKGPKTEANWSELEDHAVQLAAAGTLIQLGGVGPQDAAWAADPQWREKAVQLTTASLAARSAVQSHDLKALVTANGQIVDSCESCHAAFKPDLPTGGLILARRPNSISHGERNPAATAPAKP